MHWEKYIELTFESKGDLYCIKEKVHIWMPMPMPMAMAMPRCPCRVFQMAIIVPCSKANAKGGSPFR